MTKILVVGAGHIGRTIADMFVNHRREYSTLPDYEVLVVDCNPSNFHLIRQPGIKTKHMIIESTEFAKEVGDADYVINAGPYYIASDVALVCGQQGTHYFDLTEDVEQTSKVIKIANDYPDVAFIPQCGLAPGYISILANNLTHKFDEVVDVKMRVGALPMHPSNELKYNTTWSVDGLVNEYMQPCTLIRRGEIVEVEPLEGYETFNLDGDTYEAFNTSGGLGTLCETWHGKVQNMNYKTVRYPGHNYLMKFLINDLRLSKQQIKTMIENAIPSTTQDVVLIFVEITGKQNGIFVSETVKQKIYNGKGYSAIQLATASGICSMVRAHENRSLQPQAGFIKQENCFLQNFLEADASLWGVYCDV